MTDLMRQLPDCTFAYLHKNHPRAVLDLGSSVAPPLSNDLLNQPSMNQRFGKSSHFGLLTLWLARISDCGLILTLGRNPINAPRGIPKIG